MPYQCNSEDGNFPVLLVTNLDNGDTLAACAECAPTYLAGVLESMTGATVTMTVPDAAGDETDEDEAADETGPAEPVHPDVQPNPTPQTQPDPEPTPPPSDAPAEGEDAGEDVPGAQPDPDRPGQFMHVSDGDGAELDEGELAELVELSAFGR